MTNDEHLACANCGERCREVSRSFPLCYDCEDAVRDVIMDEAYDCDDDQDI